MELEYDPTKDAVNIAKHGISLADAMLVYNAPNKLTLESVRNGENRLMDAALVCCLRNTQTESTHGIEDLISRFCPNKRSEEHTSELQSLMRISYAVFCLKK